MLRDLIFRIIRTVDGGFAVVHVYSNRLLFILLSLDLVLFGIYMAMGKKDNIQSLVEKILVMGVFVFLINNFEGLAFMFQRSVVTLAGKIGGDFSPEFLTDPSSVLEYASRDILKPVGVLIDANTKGGILPDFKLLIIYGLSTICVMICFILIALQLALAIIEFHIILLMGLILFPFSAFEPTSFIGAKVIPAVIGQAIKLGLVSLVTGVSISVFSQILHVPSPENFNVEFLFALLGSSALLAFLSFQIPALSSSLLSGIPNLSAGGFMQNMAAFAGAAAGAGNMIQGKINNARGAAMDVVVGARAGHDLAKNGMASADPQRRQQMIDKWRRGLR